MMAGGDWFADVICVGVPFLEVRYIGIRNTYTRRGQFQGCSITNPSSETTRIERYFILAMKSPLVLLSYLAVAALSAVAGEGECDANKAADGRSCGAADADAVAAVDEVAVAGDSSEALRIKRLIEAVSRYGEAQAVEVRSYARSDFIKSSRLRVHTPYLARVIYCLCNIHSLYCYLYILLNTS